MGAANDVNTKESLNRKGFCSCRSYNVNNIPPMHTEDVFFHEILGMTLECSLNCLYCRWEQEPYKKLSESELMKAKEHIQKVRLLTDKFGAPLIGYTGGEPLLHKELVYLFLDAYHDRWVRINTNGLAIDRPLLEQMKKHGRCWLADSLDGHTMEMNKMRFTKPEQLARVIKGIDDALEVGVPVQIMVTLNPCNVNGFMEYAEWISARYSRYIQDGSLFCCAHVINNYGDGIYIIDNEEKKELASRLEDEANLPAVIRKAHWHYKDLAYYLRTGKNRNCASFSWARWTNFIDRDIAASGDFVSFVCGMYGFAPAETMNVNDPDIEETFRENLEKARKQFVALPYRGVCFTDWNGIGGVINGQVPLVEAQSWFKMFSDPQIVSWLDNRKSQAVTK